MDLDEGRRAAGFKTALCSAWMRTASRAPVWMRSWSHRRSLVPVILTVHAPAVASPLVVPRWHDLPSTCVPSRLEMWPNSARLASKWPYSLSRAPYIVLTHPAAKVHHRCRLYASPHGWSLVVDPTDLVASLMYPFNNVPRPLPPLLTLFTETDDLLLHPAVELPLEKCVILLPHDLLGTKQRAVDGVEPEQLLCAQHIHRAGRGSLGVLSMVPVEGRAVGVDVADGG
jgi:hypothetical protein